MHNSVKMVVQGLFNAYHFNLFHFVPLVKAIGISAHQTFLVSTPFTQSVDGELSNVEDLCFVIFSSHHLLHLYYIQGPLDFATYGKICKVH